MKLSTCPFCGLIACKHRSDDGIYLPTFNGPIRKILEYQSKLRYIEMIQDLRNKQKLLMDREIIIPENYSSINYDKNDSNTDSWLSKKYRLQVILEQRIELKMQ